MNDFAIPDALQSVTAIPLWRGPTHFESWFSCHGYETRSIKHLELPPFSADRKFSIGFDFPATESDDLIRERLATERQQLEDAGFEVVVGDDRKFEEVVCADLRSGVRQDRARHIVGDISSMNRSRIASLILGCASHCGAGCVLDLVYFPSTFDSHKHAYEALETFGPMHDRIAGWPAEPDFPVALVIGLGTEPRRADGIVESLEPAILSLFQPVGDEPAYAIEIREENRRVLEVGGEPVLYDIRNPEETYELLLAAVARLAEKARVVIVPLGPKIFAAMATAVALVVGPEVGVWKASAGKGVQAVDVQAVDEPVLTRFTFG